MTEKIQVEVSRDLEPLMPRFLDRRRQEIDTFRAQLAAGNFEALRIGGHSLKGSGGGYGFAELSRIGAAIEAAAKAANAPVIETALQEYADYLARVEVVFV
jgi:HPt (histidine-containing phosphotransfer) domain-containing protein